MPRPDTGGGATKKLFMQLPGVGAKTAKTWFDLGYRHVHSHRLLLNPPTGLNCWAEYSRAITAHDPRVQLSIYNVSVSRRSELG